MKGASAESRKKVNQMLKQVQHDMTVRFCSFCHPELGSDLAFGFKNLGFKAPPCERGFLLIRTRFFKEDLYDN